ncbi:dihydrodipicolinate synthase family protein [Streptococcus pneumoniae]|nr:dihydrodipicolinate synthase family protein [Streptococcus pneumoniae]HEU3701988.1 dihydrodipicolinate synthase family protein [Streptococcus pneumoniae]
MDNLKGVYVPNIIFFNSDYSINYDATINHMKWMLERGVDGFFLLGSYGLSSLVSIEEKIKFLRRIKDNVNSNFIVHIGDNNIFNSIKLAKVSEELGYLYASAVTPTYYKYTDDEVVLYFKQLVNSSNLELYVYNNPETTNVTITTSLLRKLKEVGIRGIKDSSGSTQLFLESQSLGVDYLLGTSINWPIFHMLGAECMIAGMCNYAPEIIVDLYNGCRMCNFTLMQDSYLKMLKIKDATKGINSTLISVAGVKIRQIGKEIKTKLPFIDLKENSEEYNSFEQILLNEVKQS